MAKKQDCEQEVAHIHLHDGIPADSCVTLTLDSGTTTRIHFHDGVPAGACVRVLLCGPGPNPPPPTPPAPTKK